VTAGDAALDLRLVLGSAVARRQGRPSAAPVFEGGFTMESAEAVLDLSGREDEPWAIGTVQSLLDKSFVRQVATAVRHAGERQGVRVGALAHEERFPGSGPAALAAAEARHSGYFARLRREARGGGRLRGNRQPRGGVPAGSRPGSCRRIRGRAGGAWAALNLRGPFSVGVELASIVKRHPGLGAAARAIVEKVAGTRARRLRESRGGPNASRGQARPRARGAGREVRGARAR